MNQISKYFAITTILAFSSFCLPVQAQEDITIGVVNMARVLKESPQGQAVREQLQKEFSGRKQDLVAEQTKLNGMKKRMEKDAAVMSQSEGQKLQSRISRLQRDLQRDEETFKEDFQYQRNQELAKAQEEIVKAVQTIAKKNGYDLVLGRGVLHASNQVNITEQVIKYLKGSAG